MRIKANSNARLSTERQIENRHAIRGMRSKYAVRSAACFFAVIRRFSMAANKSDGIGTYTPMEKSKSVLLRAARNFCNDGINFANSKVTALLLQLFGLDFRPRQRF
jgi:hypothetical protein